MRSHPVQAEAAKVAPTHRGDVHEIVEKSRACGDPDGRNSRRLYDACDGPDRRSLWWLLWSRSIWTATAPAGLRYTATSGGLWPPAARLRRAPASPGLLWPAASPGLRPSAARLWLWLRLSRAGLRIRRSLRGLL